MSSSFFLMFYGMSGIFIVLGILYMVIKLMNKFFTTYKVTKKDD